MKIQNEHSSGIGSTDLSGHSETEGPPPEDLYKDDIQYPDLWEDELIDESFIDYSSRSWRYI